MLTITENSGRLASLYSDFRYLHATNPEGYYANLAAWETGLSNAARLGLVPGTRNRLSLKTGPQLVGALETVKWGKPLALGAVVVRTLCTILPTRTPARQPQLITRTQNEALAQGRIIPLKAFLELSTSVYEQTWYQRSRSLVSWGLQTLGLRGMAKNELLNQQYVLLGNVEVLL